MRNQGEEAGRIKFFFFASAPSGRELTSVSDGTGGSIVSEHIFNRQRSFMCGRQGEKDGGRPGRRRKRENACFNLRSDYMMNRARADNPAQLSESHKVAS